MNNIKIAYLQSKKDENIVCVLYHPPLPAVENVEGGQQSCFADEKSQLSLLAFTVAPIWPLFI